MYATNSKGEVKTCSLRLVESYSSQLVPRALAKNKDQVKSCSSQQFVPVLLDRPSEELFFAALAKGTREEHTECVG